MPVAELVPGVHVHDERRVPGREGVLLELLRALRGDVLRRLYPAGLSVVTHCKRAVHL